MRFAFQPFKGLASTLLAAGLLCLAAIWNGQPFYFPDTPTYLRGAEMGLSRLAPPGSLRPWMTPAAEARHLAAAPAAQGLTSIHDKVVLSGRSVYYGALLYLSYLSSGGQSLWLTVIFQALCLAYVLQLLLVRLWALSTAQFLGVTAGLSLVTPMAVYTGFLMPDIFAAMLILCVALLSTAWSRLRSLDRWALSGLLLYALVIHSSHLVIAVCLFVALFAARRFQPSWRTPGSGKALGVLATCLVLAVVAEAAFVKAVTQAVGAPPLRLPHPMARLIDAGPGTDFLKKNCPQAGYAACAHVQNYPTEWVDFLFSTDPAKGAFALADPAAKRRMSEEQLRFAWDVTRADPWGVARIISTDVLRQLGRFDTDIWSFADDGIAEHFEGRVPPHFIAQMKASRAADTTAYNTWFTLSHRAAVLAAVLLFAWALLKRRRLASFTGAASRLGLFAGVVLAGVASNALVCAALASSMDRFQARVIWLLPLVAMAGVLVWRAQLRAAAAGHHGAEKQPSSPPPLIGANP